MSQFAQARNQTSSNSKRNSEHDFRIKKPNYLRDSAYHNAWKNQYFGFDAKEVQSRMRASWNSYNSLFRKRLANENKQVRNLTIGKQSDILETIITLSPKINEMLENQELSKEDLEEIFKESAKNAIEHYEDIIGEPIEVFSYVIHYDEKTPHLHLQMANHTSTGHSIHQQIKKSEYQSKLQDVIAEPFNQIGFTRGVKKSKARHLSVREMHAAEINQQKEELENLKNQIQLHKKEIKAQEISSSSKKEELDKLDILLKSTRQTIKTVKNMSVLDAKIADDIEVLIKNSKKLFLLDEEKLRENLKEKLQDYSKSNFKSLQEQNALKRVNVLEKENNELKDEILSLKATNLDYEDIINQNNTEFNELLEDYENLEKENEELKEDIGDLEKVYKFNLKDFKKNIKDLYQKTVENRELRRQ